MKMVQRLLSALTAAALTATAAIPTLPAQADTTLTFPTGFRAPTGLTVYETGEENPAMRLGYVASGDYITFASNMSQGRWVTESDPYARYCQTAYGQGYDKSYKFNMQTDYRLDGGEWHYTQDWDTNRFCTTASNPFAYFNGDFGGVQQISQVMLFDAQDMTNESSFTHQAMADCYVAQTDGDNVTYRFDKENHQLEFRCR